MTTDEVKAFVLEQFPTAVCYHHTPGPNQYSQHWVIQVDGKDIGAVGMFCEADAWIYAAQRIKHLS